MKRFALPVAALFMAACQDAAAPPAAVSLDVPGRPSAAVSAPIPGRYIVVLRPEVQDVVAVASALVAANGGSYDFIYSSALKGFAGALPEAAARAMAAHPLVRYVEQDQTMHAIAQQANPPWGLDRIDQRDLPLNNTYVYNFTGAGVHAYIIDTGIRSTHLEFTGRVGNGRDEIDNDFVPDDCNGHGTHVSGTVGGSTYGVAKAVTLHGVRVLDCGGSGSNSGVIAGVDWVTAQAKLAPTVPAVANMSLGGGFSQALNDAVTKSMNEGGVSYGLAAGNGYSNACDGSPASTGDPALTVGATDITDTEAAFSDRGPCVDIWAPGVNILSAWSTADNATNTISGTSMATPHTVGVAALYRSAHPLWTPTDVFNAIKTDATPNKVIPTDIFSAKPPFGAGQNKLLYMGKLNEGPPPPPPTPPAAPTNLTVTTPSAPAGETQIDLAWTDNSDNETGFKIERCTGATCTNFVEIATVGANAPSYSNTGLASSTTYRYQVRANNGASNSEYSNIAEGTTLAPPPPPLAPVAPSGLTATAASQTQIDLAWTDNSDNETGFKIERCTGTNCANFAQIATTGANVTTYNNTGLASGTSYSYRVRANNAGGDSPYSNTATAATAPDLPPVARYTWSCTAKGGRQCSFNATGSTDDNGISSYTWAFGDGATGSGVTVSHRYGSAGTRNVTLTVKDAANQSGIRMCPVTTGTIGECPLP